MITPINSADILYPKQLPTIHQSHRHFGARKRRWVVDYHVFQRFSSKVLKNGMFGTKKCFRENVMLELGVRQTFFCTPLDDADGY